MENYNIHLDQNRPKPELEKSTPAKASEGHYNDDEIDLRDYINVLIKRKWAIGAIFLITVIAAAIISLLMSPTYEAINLVEIGKSKDKILETPDEIKEIFARRTILKEIAGKLNLPEDKNIESISEFFTIESPMGASSNLLRIKGRAETPKKSVEVANVVADALIERHDKLFSEAKETFESEVETIVKSKEKTEKDIERIKADIVRLNTDIKKYEQEISKRSDIQTEGQGRIAESYINLLASVKNQKENKEAQILDLEQGLISLNQSIQQKEYEKAYQTKPTKIEVEATLPETRISPKRKQNVMIAGIIGLFVGVFYAFAAEYFGKESRVIG